MDILTSGALTSSGTSARTVTMGRQFLRQMMLFSSASPRVAIWRNGGVSLLQCAKLGQRYFMPILLMGHESGGIAMRKAISLDMGHAHGVTGLVQPLGQGLQFGGSALQPMQQQHCMFFACQGD